MASAILSGFSGQPWRTLWMEGILRGAVLNKPCWPQNWERVRGKYLPYSDASPQVKASASPSWGLSTQLPPLSCDAYWRVRQAHRWQTVWASLQPHTYRGDAAPNWLWMLLGSHAFLKQRRARKTFFHPLYERGAGLWHLAEKMGTQWQPLSNVPREQIKVFSSRTSRHSPFI